MSESTPAKKKGFPAKLEQLYPMLDFISLIAEDQGFEKQEIGKIQMASEEALVNVIHYAYPDGAGDLEIICSIVEKDILEIIVKDEGLPFNPLEDSEEVDINATAEQRRIGGLGVLMIRKFMDHVGYQRVDNSNVLTMRKNKLA
jgi:serine/threonine-protein kinase RsbW